MTSAASKIDVLVISDQEQITGRFRFLDKHPDVELRYATSLDTGLMELASKSPRLLFFSGGLSGLSADLIARSLGNQHKQRGARRYYLATAKQPTDLGNLVTGTIDASLDEARFMAAVNAVLLSAIPKIKAQAAIAPVTTRAKAKIKSSGRKIPAAAPVKAAEIPAAKKTDKRLVFAGQAPAEPASEKTGAVRQNKPARLPKAAAASKTAIQKPVTLEPAKSSGLPAKHKKKPAKKSSVKKSSVPKRRQSTPAATGRSQALAQARAALEGARKALEAGGSDDPVALALAAAINVAYSIGDQESRTPAEMAAETVCEPPPFSPAGTVVSPDGSIQFPFDSILLEELARQTEEAALEAEELEAERQEMVHADEAVQLQKTVASRASELMELTEPRQEFVFVSESAQKESALRELRRWLSTEPARVWLAEMARSNKGRKLAGGMLALVVVIFVVIYQSIQQPRQRKHNPFAVEPVASQPVKQINAESVPAPTVAAAVPTAVSLAFLDGYEQIKSDKPGWLRYRQDQFEVRVFTSDGTVRAIQAINQGAGSDERRFSAIDSALLPGGRLPGLQPAAAVNQEMLTSKGEVDGVKITLYTDASGIRKGVVYDLSSFKGEIIQPGKKGA